MKRRRRPDEVVYAGDIDANFLPVAWSCPRRLILSSSGGEVETALAAADMFLRAGDVEVVAAGQCMSSAIVVLAAARRRLALPHTRFMTHAATASLQSADYHTLGAEHAETRRLEADVAELLGERTKRDAQWWMDASEHLFYFGPEAAVDYGLIHEVLR